MLRFEVVLWMTQRLRYRPTTDSPAVSIFTNIIVDELGAFGGVRVDEGALQNFMCDDAAESRTPKCCLW